MRFPFLSRTVVPCLDLSLHRVFVSTYSVFRGLWQLSLMRCEAIAVIPRYLDETVSNRPDSAGVKVEGGGGGGAGGIA